MQSGVDKYFDSLAAEYVNSREGQVSFRSQKRIVIDMLAGVQGRLLEVGCGPAVMTPDLLAMGFEVDGIDVSAEMVRNAELRMAGHPLRDRSRFALGDVEKLAYADESFDAVICMGVLEYLPHYSRAIAEISRVLVHRGTAIFTVPNRASAYHVARSGYRRAVQAIKRGVRARTAPARVEHNLCVPWRLDRELASAGLRKVESQACNFIFYPLTDLLPRASNSLNRALTPLAPLAFAPLLGAQYVVSVEKVRRLNSSRRGTPRAV